MQPSETQPSDDALAASSVTAMPSRAAMLSSDVEQVMRQAIAQRRGFMASQRMISKVRSPGEGPAVAAEAAQAVSAPASNDLVIDGAITVASLSAGAAAPVAAAEADLGKAAKPKKAKRESAASSNEALSSSNDLEAAQSASHFDATEDLSEEDEESLEERAVLSSSQVDLDEDSIEKDAKAALKAANAEGAESASTISRALRLKRLSKEEFDELLAQYKDGDSRAFEKMVNHSMGLVVSCARKYLGRGVPFDDLVQEGAMGLMHGITKYNPDLGYRPATYLFHWIRQRMGRHVDNTVGMIKAPSTIRERISKLHSEAQRAEAAGAENAQELRRRSDEAYSELNRTTQTTSVNLTQFEDSDETLGDMLADDSADVETTIAHRQTIDLLVQCVAALDDRARFIVAAKTDLLMERFEDLHLADFLRKNDLMEFMTTYIDGSGRGRSLRDLGEALNLTAERCNQIFRQSMNEVASEMACSVGGKENLSVVIENFDTDALESKAAVERSRLDQGASRRGRKPASEMTKSNFFPPIGESLDLFGDMGAGPEIDSNSPTNAARRPR